MSSFLGIGAISKRCDQNRHYIVYNKRRFFTDIVYFALLLILLLVSIFSSSLKETTLNQNKKISVFPIVCDELHVFFEELIPKAEETKKDVHTGILYNIKLFLLHTSYRLYRKTWFVASLMVLCTLVSAFLSATTVRRHGFVWLGFLPFFLLVQLFVLVFTTVKYTQSVFADNEPVPFFLKAFLLVTNIYGSTCIFALTVVVIGSRKAVITQSQLFANLVRPLRVLCVHVFAAGLCSVFLATVVLRGLFTAVFCLSCSIFVKLLLAPLLFVTVFHFFVCFCYATTASTVAWLFVLSLKKFSNNYDFVPSREYLECAFRLFWGAGTVFAVALGNAFVYPVCQLPQSVAVLASHMSNVMSEALLANIAFLSCDMRLFRAARRAYDKLVLCGVALAGTDWSTSVRDNLEHRKQLFGDFYFLRKLATSCKLVLNLAIASAAFVAYSFEGLFESDLLVFWEEQGVWWFAGPLFDGVLVATLAFLAANLGSIALEAVFDSVAFCLAKTKLVVSNHLAKDFPLCGYFDLKDLLRFKQLGRREHGACFVRALRYNRQLRQQQRLLLQQELDRTQEKYNYAYLGEFSRESQVDEHTTRLVNV